MHQQEISAQKAKEVKQLLSSMSPSEIKRDFLMVSSNEGESTIEGVECEFNILDDDSTLNIYHLWLDPQLRRQSFGSKLLEAVLLARGDFSQTISSVYVTIQAVDDTGGTEAFLKEKGFTIVGRTQNRRYENELVEAELEL